MGTVAGNLFNLTGNSMLSDTKIKSLKPKEKIYRVLDAERLYIEVRPTGKKLWRFKYTLNGKKVL